VRCSVRSYTVANAEGHQELARDNLESADLTSAQHSTASFAKSIQ
jgi:hypothetical protein